ncbi:MAG: hypothetical protein LBK52_04000 [Deltaproteobacteria bacterium]|jgi:hypothetical protein|nr:hypothetical protein [Deltaproteobacteria bacterium]
MTWLPKSSKAEQTLYQPAPRTIQGDFSAGSPQPAGLFLQKGRLLAAPGRHLCAFAAFGGPRLQGHTGTLAWGSKNQPARLVSPPGPEMIFLTQRSWPMEETAGRALWVPGSDPALPPAPARPETAGPVRRPELNRFLDPREGWLAAVNDLDYAAPDPSPGPWPGWQALPEALPEGVSFLWLSGDSLLNCAVLVRELLPPSESLWILSDQEEILARAAALFEAPQSAVVLGPALDSRLAPLDLETILDRSYDRHQAELAQVRSLCDGRRSAAANAAARLQKWEYLKTLEEDLGRLNREAASRETVWAFHSGKLAQARDSWASGRRPRSVWSVFRRRPSGSDQKLAAAHLEAAEAEMARIRREKAALLEEAKKLTDQLNQAREIVKNLPSPEELAAVSAAAEKESRHLEQTLASLAQAWSRPSASRLLLESKPAVLVFPGWARPEHLQSYGPPDNLLLASPAGHSPADRQALAQLAGWPARRLIAAADFTGWFWEEERSQSSGTPADLSPPFGARKKNRPKKPARPPAGPARPAGEETAPETDLVTRLKSLISASSPPPAEPQARPEAEPEAGPQAGLKTEPPAEPAAGLKAGPQSGPQAVPSEKTPGTEAENQVRTEEIKTVFEDCLKKEEITVRLDPAELAGRLAAAGRVSAAFPPAEESASPEAAVFPPEADTTAPGTAPAPDGETAASSEASVFSAEAETPAPGNTPAPGTVPAPAGETAAPEAAAFPPEADTPAPGKAPAPTGETAAASEASVFSAEAETPAPGTAPAGETAAPEAAAFPPEAETPAPGTVPAPAGETAAPEAAAFPPEADTPAPGKAPAPAGEKPAAGMPPAWFSFMPPSGAENSKAGLRSCLGPLPEAALQSRPDPARFPGLAEIGLPAPVSAWSWPGPWGPIWRAPGENGPFSPVSALAAVQLARAFKKTAPQEQIYLLAPSPAQGGFLRALIQDLAPEMTAWAAGTIPELAGWPPAGLVILDTALGLAHPWAWPGSRPDLLEALRLAAGGLIMIGAEEQIQKLASQAPLRRLWNYASPGRPRFQWPLPAGRPMWEALDQARREAFFILPVFETAWWHPLSVHFQKALNRQVRTTILTQVPAPEQKEYSGQVIRDLRLYGAQVILAEGFDGFLGLIDQKTLVFGEAGRTAGGRTDWSGLKTAEIPLAGSHLAQAVQAPLLAEKLGPRGYRNCPLCGWPHVLYNLVQVRDFNHRQSLRLGCLNPACPSSTRPRRLDERWPFLTPPVCRKDEVTLYTRRPQGRGEVWVCPAHDSCPKFKVIPGDALRRK